MTNPKRIAVLKGGWSPEREVSLVSGAAAAKSLLAEGFEVVEIDVTHDLPQQLLDAKPDVALNCLHGQWGEDGCVQGVLEVMGIPYSHSGVAASALAMDKEKAKAVMRHAGLPVPDGKIMSVKDIGPAHPIAPPYVIKPNNQGSSVGVFIIEEGANRPPNHEKLTQSYDVDEMLVETFIKGRELTVSVLGDNQLGAKPLAVTEIIAHKAFYDFEAKYAEGGSSHIVPAQIPADIEAACFDMAEKAHNILGCRGLTRTDFRYDEERGLGGLCILEVNTQPGLTPSSLAPEQAAFKGMSFGDLMRWMVGDATCNR